MKFRDSANQAMVLKTGAGHVRRVRRGMTTSIVSTVELDGHDPQWAKRSGEGGFAGRFLTMSDQAPVVDVKTPSDRCGCWAFFCGLV